MLKRAILFFEAVLKGTSAYHARWRLDAVIAFDRVTLGDHRRIPWSLAADDGECDARCNAFIRMVRARCEALRGAR